MKVQLFGSLKERQVEKAVDGSLVVELGNKTTLEELLDILEIPAEEVVVTLVNGIAENRNYSIKNGDAINVFPPPIGG